MRQSGRTTRMFKEVAEQMENQMYNRGKYPQKIVVLFPTYDIARNMFHRFGMEYSVFLDLIGIQMPKLWYYKNAHVEAHFTYIDKPLQEGYPIEAVTPHEHSILCSNNTTLVYEDHTVYEYVQEKRDKRTVNNHRHRCIFVKVGL